MSNVSRGIDLLIAAAQEHTAARAEGDVALLEDLKLYVEMREAQSMTLGDQAMIELEVKATTHPGQGGITITCVGYAGNMESAVSDAVGQWCLGVLPVLAQWRSGHSCFCTLRELKTRSGAFDLAAGPILGRDIEAEAEAKPPIDGSLLEALIPLVEAARPALRTHWIEMYACKFADGSVDATCRLNNHDYLSAKKVLLDTASAWPQPGGPMRSSRQFAMLMPRNGPAQEIVLPSVWDRLRGKA